MEDINEVVAENLKQIREGRRLSLDAVARASGVSKSMLGQIERKEVNPTISTVWKIARGLNVPFSRLVNRPEAECEVIKADDIQPLLEDNGHYRNYPVFPYGDGRRFEMLYIEMDEGSRLDAEPHPAGTQEFITVFSGELTVQVGGRTLAASDRCSLRFCADRPHQYQNTGAGVCRLSMVIAYPAQGW